MQAAHDCPDRNSNNIGDFLVFELFNRPKGDYETQFLGQLIQRPAQILIGFPLSIGRLKRLGDELKLLVFHGLGLPGFASGPGHMQILQYADEPSADAVRTKVEAFPCTDRAQVGFLNEIIGFGCIAGKCAGNAIDRVDLFQSQLLKFRTAELHLRIIV